MTVGCGPGKGNSSTGLALELILDKIHAGHRSFFSLSMMAQNFELLSTRKRSDVFLQCLPKENIVSRLGRTHLERATAYLKANAFASIVEYLVLIGRYHVLGALLLGGISPCVRGIPEDTTLPSKRDQEIQAMANPVLKRFFDCFPLSLSSYIVKRVVDMRLRAVLNQTQQSIVCGICQKETQREFSLMFTKDFEAKEPCCRCSFCEVCFWRDMLERVDCREGDVVQCPCCTRQDDHTKTDSIDVIERVGPQERCQESLEKYQSLPVDSEALKQSGRKKKKITELEALSSHWDQAVLPSLGLCQTVRRDKLFTFTDKRAVPHVKGCLHAGVDINATNEYGQSALYIAAWHGNPLLVKLLLEWGANPFICSNGIGMTLDGVCSAHRHVDCLQIIQQFRKEYWLSEHLELNPDRKEKLPPLVHGKTPKLEVLIDSNQDHPGAGSYLISNCIHDVTPLLDLWQCLPIDQSSPKKEKKGIVCADRAYFCDAEGWLRSTLTAVCLKAFQANEQEGGDIIDAICLSQMRFLHYIAIGAALAPHIDLNRMDPESGRRSTHSFLLYLTTCERGGETILLEDVKGAGRDVILSRVKPQCGHLLLFPHECPHEGNIVETVPKILIRGEIVLVKKVVL